VPRGGERGGLQRRGPHDLPTGTARCSPAVFATGPRNGDVPPRPRSDRHCRTAARGAARRSDDDDEDEAKTGGRFIPGRTWREFANWERLLKSGLCVSRLLAPSLSWSDGDLANWFETHEEQFLAERAFGVRRLEFRSAAEAREARRTILAEGLSPAAAVERWAPGALPYELSAAEARRLPGRQGAALIETDVDHWSEPVDNGLAGAAKRWVLYHLLGRRMPDIDESPELRAAVEQRVREAMLDAAIARTVEAMEQATGWTRVEVLR